MKIFFMKINVSSFAMDVILLQVGADDKLYLIAFHSRKFLATKIKYKIHDKELLAITDLFQEWCHYLEGASSPVIVYMDHKNLKYFISAYVLNHCQAR